MVELFIDFFCLCLKEWLLEGKIVVNGDVIIKLCIKVMGGEVIIV